MELDDVPRPDPEVVDVPLHRRCKVTDDDPDLHRLGERRLAHRSNANRSPRARLSQVL
jgi:hypothetical protein